MPVFGGSWIYKDTEIDVWLDPNRYRIIIWGRSARHPEIFSTKIKRLHDKDKKHGLKRAVEWIDRMSQGKLANLQVNEYQLQGGGPHDAEDVTLKRYGQIDSSSKWSIFEHGAVLNKQGEWELEPIPSSRDDDYIQRARFDTADEAITFWFQGNFDSRFAHYRQDNAGR